MNIHSSNVAWLKLAGTHLPLMKYHQIPNEQSGSKGKWPIDKLYNIIMCTVYTHIYIYIYIYIYIRMMHLLDFFFV